MEKHRIFSVDELNRMGLEAVAGRERTSITGPEAQQTFEAIRKDVAKMKREGATPLPVAD